MHNSVKKWLVCLVLVTIILKAESQEIIDFKAVDSVTYHHYIENQWKELIRVSNNAFKNDIDYYYLRMRAGTAHFERKNYIKAKDHFKKAVVLNHLEEAPLNYLYYSFLYRGNRDMGKYMYHKYNKYSDDLKLAAIKPLSSIQFVSSYLKNSENTPLNRMMPAVSLNDGYQTVTNSLFYNSLSLKHDISPSIYFTHSFGFMKKDNYYMNSFQGSLSQSDKSELTQHQYYASLKYIPADNFFINTAIHYIRYSIEDISYRELISELVYQVPGARLNNFAWDISLFKSFWLIDAGAGLSMGNLNNNRQFQQNFTLAFYPFGNLNLYTVSKLNLIHEKEQESISIFNPLIRNTLGFKVFNNLWLEGTLWNGDFKNAVLNEAYYIVNSNENQTSKYDVSFIIPFEHMSLNLQFSNMNYYTSFYTNSGRDTGENKTEYNNLNILMSIKWNI